LQFYIEISLIKIIVSTRMWIIRQKKKKLGCELICRLYIHRKHSHRRKSINFQSMFTTHLHLSKDTSRPFEKYGIIFPKFNLFFLIRSYNKPWQLFLNKITLLKFNESQWGRNFAKMTIHPNILLQFIHLCDDRILAKISSEMSK
jgi:hypothetical protein